MSTADSSIPLHPTARALVEQMQALPQGPRLADETFAEWTRTLPALPERQEIAVHLLALAQRFFQQKADFAAAQLIVLATYALGSAQVERAAPEAGQRMLQVNPAANPAASLAPPASRRPR